jgi:hypothetical protein
VWKAFRSTSTANFAAHQTANVETQQTANIFTLFCAEAGTTAFTNN